MNFAHDRRIVITGIGSVSPIGIGVKRLAKAAFQGEVGKLDLINDRRKNQVLTYVIDREAVHKRVMTLRELYQGSTGMQCPVNIKASNPIQASFVATYDALNNSGILENNQVRLPERMRERTSLAMGCPVEVAKCERLLNTAERIPTAPIESVGSYSATELARTFLIEGSVVAINQACSSAITCLDALISKLRSGVSDIGLSGTVDLDVANIPEGFSDAGLLLPNNDQYSPMDADNKGIRLGEGAGTVVVETLENVRNRNAEDKIYAELITSAGFCDASDKTTPSGLGLERSIREVLRQSGVNPKEITFVQVHGTGNKASDEVEINVLKNVFDDHFAKLKITANKSRYGHSIHNAGFYNIAELALSLKDGKATPTIKVANPRCPSPPLVTNINDQSSDAKYGIAISMGFGGLNNCVLLKKWDGD